MQIRDVVTFLKRFAPASLAEDWDNVGLLVGDDAAEVSTLLTCLTLTADVVREAIDHRAHLVISHHPLIFRPIQRITTADPQGRLLLDLIGAGIGLYSPHTGYDSATLGINRQLAELIGLQNVKPLRPLPRPRQVKIVCFVPRTNLETVQHALWDSGAGRIGDYSQCSFYGPGTGTFRGSDNSKPAIGQAGKLEQTDEVRLEVVCSYEYAEQAVARMLAVHPYEEPAVDVYSLQSSDGDEGAGRFGTLTEEMSLDKFLDLVKRVLRMEHLQFVGDPQAVVRCAAIACGSGGEFLQDAVRCGCDVLLTGEARFHAALEASAAGIGLVLAGHYATERPAMERLSEVLTLQFPELTVWASRMETDPLEWA